MPAPSVVLNRTPDPRPLMPMLIRRFGGIALLTAVLVSLAVPSQAAFRGGRSAGFHGGGFAGGRGFVGARPFGGTHVFVRGGFQRFGPPVRVVRPYFGPRFRRRPFVSFGLGLGFPHYCYGSPTIVYERVVEPEPVIVEPEPTDRAPARDDARGQYAPRTPSADDEIDVENLPPAGCYYYDRFCNRRFATLDDYTDHLEHRHHAQTIAVIDKQSGDRLRTLEFVDGVWQVQK